MDLEDQFSDPSEALEQADGALEKKQYLTEGPKI